jgi:hypothetical protein
MARYVDVHILNIGFILCLKRWGSTYNFCNVRIVLLPGWYDTTIPGAYCDLSAKWPRRDFPNERLKFYFDAHYFMKMIREPWRDRSHRYGIKMRKLYRLCGVNIAVEPSSRNNSRQVI